MKTTETTLNQEVKSEIKAQNKHNEARVNTITKELPKGVTKELLNTIIKDLKELPKLEVKPTTKKEPTVRAESNEALGERLLKEKASEERILKEFAAVYKAKSGIVDKVFVVARAAIYMKIAKKRAAKK